MDAEADWYPVRIEESITSAEVLDWICQVDGRFTTSQRRAEVVAGLVAAFNSVLTPQANLCSWGKSSTLTREQIRGFCAALLPQSAQDG